MSEFLKPSGATVASGTIKQPIVECITYTGYNSGTTSGVLFGTRDPTRSNENKLIQVDTSVTTHTRYKVLKDCNVNVVTSMTNSSASSYYVDLIHCDSTGTVIKRTDDSTASSFYGQGVITTKASVGDYFYVITAATVINNIQCHFSITATAIEESAPNFTVSLPVSKENVFSANIASNGTITSKSADWLSVVLSDTSLYTIDISKLGLTVAPSISIKAEGPFGLGIQNVGLGAYLVSSSATQIVVRTAQATGGSNLTSLALAQPFKIIIQKQSPDYTAPGVFVGNVQREWQYDISSYLSGASSIASAKCVVKKMANGNYRGYFNIDATVTTGTTNSLTLSGASFPAYNQSLGSTSSTGSVSSCALVNASSSTITRTLSSTGTVFLVHGEVDFTSKPTWAIYTE